MSILALPVEIITLIGEACSTFKDLNALSRANCQLFNILNKYLYRRDFFECDTAFLAAAKKDNQYILNKIIREAKGRRLSFSNAAYYAVRYKSNTCLRILVKVIPKSDSFEEFLEGGLIDILRGSRWYYDGFDQISLLLSILHSVDLSQRPKLSSYLWDCAIVDHHVRFAKLLLKIGIQPSDAHYTRIFATYCNPWNKDLGEKLTNLLLYTCPNSALSPATFSTAVQADCVPAVKDLLKGGADWKALDANGYPPLWHAIHRGRISNVLKYLLDHGPIPNAKSADRETIVDHAIKNDCYEAASVLVDHGADFLQVKLQHCKKLICYDLSLGKFKSLQQILPQRINILRGQDVIQALRDHFPTRCCSKEKFEKILGHLRWFGAHRQSNVISSVKLFDRSLVSLMPTDGDKGTALICRLLEYGANPNVHIPRHGSALEAVAKGKNYHCLRLLRKYGLDLGKWDHAYLERILGLAIASGNSNLVSLLLERGINPDFKQKKSVCGSGTPIWQALLRKHSSIVQFLVSGGADIHTRQDGWTLLGHAANNRVLSVIHPLLEAGADPLEKSGPQEKTALEWLLCPSDQINEGTTCRARENIANMLINRYTEEQLMSEGPRILSLATTMKYRTLHRRLINRGVPLPKSCMELD